MADDDAPSGRAWRLLGLLTFLNVLNFVDRQLISSLVAPLQKDLSLTDVQIALLAGYAFSMLYGLAGLYLGSLADRCHRPHLIAAGLVIWSGATAASGLATNFTELAAARIVVGIGEAVLTPSAMAMLGDVFHSRRRGFAAGVYYMGIPLGSGLSLIIAGLAGPYLGWRGCFYSLGIIGVASALAVWFLKDPTRGAMDSHLPVNPSAPVRKPSLLASLGEVRHALRTTPSLAFTILGSVIGVFSVGGTYLDAKWIIAERGFDQWKGPLFLGVLFLIGGSVGNLLGGWLGDWCRHRWKGGRLWAIIAVILVITPFTVAYKFLPANSPFLGVACCISSILVTVSYGPVLGTIQDLAPARIRASTVALTLLGQNLFGASLGVLVAAKLAGLMQSLTWGIFITAQLGLFAVPMYLLAIRFYPAEPAAPPSRIATSESNLAEIVP